jgi:hypothetical protein
MSKGLLITPPPAQWERYGAPRPPKFTPAQIKTQMTQMTQNKFVLFGLLGWAVFGPVIQ